MLRQCGTCTKCCEGHLVGTINGKEMYPGKPCYLLQIGKGCSDYENRPEEPCKAFNCQWITNTLTNLELLYLSSKLEILSL